MYAGRPGFDRVVLLSPATNVITILAMFAVFLLVGSAYRTEIGPGETGVGHGLLLRDRLGGIWEAASNANRPEPGPTELKQSL